MASALYNRIDLYEALIKLGGSVTPKEFEEHYLKYFVNSESFHVKREGAYHYFYEAIIGFLKLCMKDPVSVEDLQKSILVIQQQYGDMDSYNLLYIERHQKTVLSILLNASEDKTLRPEVTPLIKNAAKELLQQFVNDSRDSDIINSFNSDKALNEWGGGWDDSGDECWH